jgi:hypothetical protein
VLYWIVFLAILAAVEWNALVGAGQARQKFLGTVRGTIHAGLGITALFCVVALILA